MQNNNLKLEKMRYQNNSLSYMLGMLGIAASVLAAFMGLNSYKPVVSTIFKILLNIGILLFGFLAIEKTKNYRKQFCIVLIVIGAICFARIFWVPIRLMMYTNYAEAILKGSYNGALTIEDCQKVLAEVCCPLQYTDGVFKYSSTGWLPNSGVVRGIMMIIELAIASASFIAAGVIGLRKSIMLENYLTEIEKK